MIPRVHLRAAVALVAFTISGSTAHAEFDYKSQLGVVESMSDGRLCLMIPNPSLAPHDGVDIILDDSPQRQVMAEVVASQNRSCSRPPQNEAADFYVLRLNTGRADAGARGLGILNYNSSFQESNGRVGFNPQNGTFDYFRSCASSEGLHLTGWKGPPLKGRRMWQRYYYLGYDVEPSCSKAEISGNSK
jgi:hypothetical protein